jgi:hypothetical protein
VSRPRASLRPLSPRIGSGEHVIVRGGPAADPAGSTTLVLIRCTPGSDVLEATHAYLTSYATTRFGARSAERLAVAAYELFANAMSFGTLSDVCVELLEASSGGAVRVANTTTAARLGMLKAHLDRLERDGPAMLANEMRRFASGGPRPMLGLARIRYEAGMTLDVGISGERVTITSQQRR